MSDEFPTEPMRCPDCGFPMSNMRGGCWLCPRCQWRSCE